MAFVKLGEQLSKGFLTSEQEHVYQILEVLLSGIIVILPLSHFLTPNLLGPIKLRPLSFLSTEIPVDRPWLEWQRLRVEQEVLSMASNVIDVHTKKVDGWFPSPS